MPSLITVYGIVNCTSVKKARAWLEDHAIAYTFHDFKKQGVPEAALDQWLDALGWEKVINRQGTTWRKLPVEQQQSLQGREQARALILHNPSLIKRPLIDWGVQHSSTPQTRYSVGFTPEHWRHTR